MDPQRLIRDARVRFVRDLFVRHPHKGTPVLTFRSRSARAAALTAAALAATPLLIGSSTAATTTSSAVGSAGASISLLRVDNATASLRALTASLNSSTATSPDTASVSVTPVWSSASGAVGQLTVTPADSPKHVGAGSLALPSGLASLSSPAIDVVASVTGGTATAGITGSALGAITVLGKPLQVAGGALNLSSSVTKTAATSSKSVTVSQLALPTIADLLASLGLDVAKLTQDQLMALFAIVQSTAGSTLANAVTAANAAVDAAQVAAGSAASTISAAQGVLASRQSDLAAAQSDATAAQATLASAQASFDAAIAPVNSALTGGVSALKTALNAAGITAPFDANSWQAMSGATKTAVDAAVNSALGSGTAAAIDAAAAAVSAANAALAAANAAVAAAQALVDAAQALVAALLDLINAVVAALDADPLATLGGIDAGTEATASKTAAADGHLSVGSLEVLGATQAVSNLTSALGSVTTALSGVLNGITGVTFTPPSISVGNVSKVTSVDKGTASALVTVAGVKITLPTLRLPTTLGLAGGASLPGIDLVNGALQSIAGTVTVAELRDSATFTQAGSVVPNTPGTPGGGTDNGGGSLPTTGAPAALGLLALATIGFAVLLRRRAHSEA